MPVSHMRRGRCKPQADRKYGTDGAVVPDALFRADTMPRIRAKRAARRRLLVATSSSPTGQELHDAVSINPEIAVPDAKCEEFVTSPNILTRTAREFRTLTDSVPFPAELRLQSFLAHPAPTADKVLYLSRTG